MALAVVLAGAAGLLAPGLGASADCTPAPGPDPIASSDIIVAGKIIGWQVATDIERPTPVTPDSYEPVPVRLYLGVDRAFKGNATTQLEFVNDTSLEFQDGRYSWTFATFACGDFRGDPSGTYLVIGLAHGADGTLRETARFYEGKELAGHAYEDVISRLGTGYLPAKSGPPQKADVPTGTLVAVASALAIVVATVGMALMHGRGTEA
ncbi:MAG TPA: hypothetical protein VLS25_11410 [Dehalococcoidia bacterium]|nr:hypothetical protein [Dehalococcoidia bacterium]